MSIGGISFVTLSIALSTIAKRVDMVRLRRLLFRKRKEKKH
jgi:hypothetical protein